MEAICVAILMHMHQGCEATSPIAGKHTCFSGGIACPKRFISSEVLRSR